MSKGKHTVQQNETLSHVAKQHYGKVDYWKGLVKANKDIIKRENYLKRHAVREDWNHVNAGSLSAFVLWGPTTSITENLVKYFENFGIDY